MILGRQVAHNTIIHLTGKLVSLVLGLVSIGIMTRYLGQEGFGFYITVTAFLQFFGILVDFGLSLTTIQMISKPGVKLSKLMNSIMSLRVISSFAFLALAPIVIWFFPYNNYIKWGVLVMVFSFFCISLIQTLTGVFQQKLKMLEVTLAEVVGRVLLVVLVALGAMWGKDIYWIFAAITVGSVLNLLIVLLCSRKYIKWRFEIDLQIWKEVLTRTWPIALSISFNLIYLKMDILILSLTRTQAEVGLYGATYRVIDILTMLPAVFMGIVLPIATKLFLEKNNKDLKQLLQKSFDTLMIFAVPIVLGTMIIASKVMTLVAGNDFAQSGPILKVLILASGAIFATTLFGYGVVAVNKQKSMMWGYLTTAVLTMIGYLIFIPSHGYWGAAWMTVFSEVMVLLWTAYVVYKTVKFFPSFTVLMKALVSALVMTAVLFYLPEIHVLFMLIIAVVIYFPALYLLGGIKKQTVSDLIKLK